MSETQVWLMILGVAAVSMAPRILPVAFFSRREMAPWLKRWLSFIAPAVLGALAAVSILAPAGKIDLSGSNLYLWAFFPTLAVGLKTKNIFLTLFAGIISMALLYHLAG